ncbi:unnamed protein product [Amoebophrya sp. A120]|nr:unnamed protein product [Amoebophrya sp. A120]|eukprot:GSA120T00011418001.1
MVVLPGADEIPDEERNMFKRNKEPRFYENDVPNVNELVMVKVLRVAETSAYVQCLEYSGLEGMILFSEVSTRRIRSMLKEIRVGQFCVCLVLRVDKERGHLDMSRRRVNADDRATFLQRYTKSKLVHSTMRQLSAVHQIPCEELCQKIAWPLYKKYPHAVDAFKHYINSRDEGIFGDMDVPEKVFKNMLQIIEKKLTPQAIKLKAKIEVYCYEIEGIDAVKEALLAGLDQGEAAKVEGSTMGQIAIKVVAPPHYDVTTQSVGKEAGMQEIDAALDRIKSTIEKKGGVFVLKSKPEVQEGGDDEILERDVASDAERDDDEEDSDEEQDETMGNVDLSAFADKKP